MGKRMFGNGKIQELIDGYQHRRDACMPRLEAFMRGERPFLVSMGGPASYTRNCNAVDDCLTANLNDFATALTIESDTLPYLEPWFGTGAYAEAFGCEYVWRDDESPACHYRYQKIEEVVGLRKPSIEDGTIFRMILDAIMLFKEVTRGKLPITPTDTQSAHDTATLILNAVEVFTASYTAPEILHDFLTTINNLIIEFTQRQIDALGDCACLPGHIMGISTAGGPGISISEDNVAVCSPTVNELSLLPYTDKVGAAFGGVAIHSCGDFSHSMPLMAKMQHLMMVDCTTSARFDPNPCTPEAVREAFRGTGVIVQVRYHWDPEDTTAMIKRLWADDLRLVMRIGADPAQSTDIHRAVTTTLEELYS